MTRTAGRERRHKGLVRCNSLLGGAPLDLFLQAWDTLRPPDERRKEACHATTRRRIRQPPLLSSPVANGGRGYPSETHVRRGLRVVHGDKELLEKLGRNDLCPCGSGRRFQELLPSVRYPGRKPAALLSQVTQGRPRIDTRGRPVFARNVRPTPRSAARAAPFVRHRGPRQLHWLLSGPFVQPIRLTASRQFNQGGQAAASCSSDPIVPSARQLDRPLHDPR